MSNRVNNEEFENEHFHLTKTFDPVCELFICFEVPKGPLAFYIAVKPGEIKHGSNLNDEGLPDSGEERHDAIYRYADGLMNKAILRKFMQKGKKNLTQRMKDSMEEAVRQIKLFADQEFEFKRQLGE